MHVSSPLLYRQYNLMKYGYSGDETEAFIEQILQTLQSKHKKATKERYQESRREKRLPPSLSECDENEKVSRVN